MGLDISEYLTVKDSIGLCGCSPWTISFTAKSSWSLRIELVASGYT
jgi:hypothetical protein